jgi:hypothetical protein
MKPEGMRTRLRRILSPPVFPEDEEKTRIADLLNAVLLSVLFVALVFGIPSIIITPSLKRILAELTLILTMIGLLFSCAAGGCAWQASCSRWFCWLLFRSGLIGREDSGARP